MDAPFRRALPSEEVGPPPFASVTLDGERILLTRLGDGTVVAFEAACPHQGQPLSDGLLSGGVLECARHFYGYDLRDGRNVFPGDPGDPPLTVYEVVERDGWVWVGPPAGATAAPGGGPAGSAAADTPG